MKRENYSKKRTHTQTLLSCLNPLKLTARISKHMLDTKLDWEIHTISSEIFSGEMNWKFILFIILC